MRIVIDFLKDTYELTKAKIKDLFSTFINHTEAVVILSFSALGINVALGELPFVYTLPMWVEAPLIIPFASMMIVVVLLKSMNIRFNNRVAI